MAPRTTLLAALLVTSVLGVGLAGSAAASPRPVAVCEPCDRGFLSAARAHGVDARIERSTATMRVHRNGTATWTVENRVTDAAATAFRNDSLRRSVAEAAVEVHDGRLLSTSVDGDVVRLRYRTPDAATAATGGVLRVETFRDDPGARVTDDLGADRLTLLAPEGTVVGRALPGADVDGRRMTVTTFESRGDGPFVTLVPEGNTLGPLWSLLAVAAPLAPVVGRNVLLLVGVPAAVFGAGLGSLARLARVLGLAAAPTGGPPDRRALLVVALGGLGLAHPLFGDLVFLGGSTPALVAVSAGLVSLGGGLAVPSVRERCSFVRLGGVVAGAFAVALAVGLLLQTLPLGDLSIRDDAVVARLVLPALPLYAVTLAGYAAAHGRPRRGLATAAGAYALVPAATFSITSRGGSLYFLGVFLSVLGAVGGVVFGIPLFALGYGLPGPDGGSSGATATDEAENASA
jgi:hypothetical protein